MSTLITFAPSPARAKIRLVVATAKHRDMLAGDIDEPIQLGSVERQ